MNNRGQTKWKIYISIFLLIILVSFLQFFILHPFEVGLTPDDWSFIFWYKSLGQNPLLKFSEVWKERGAYTTFFVYYIGILNDIWGLNYQAIGLTNIALKVLATISIFPMVLIIFKNRALAFLSTLLYAISYSAVGSLEFAVKGADYLSIFFMNIFLISYYFLVRKNTWRTKWFPISVFLLVITLIASTIRSYPLLVLLILIEFFIWIYQKRLSIKIGLVRITTLYFPFVLVLFYKPSVIVGFFGTGLNELQKIAEGNWHLVLTPIQGLGFMLVPLEVWGHLIKPLIFKNFYDYSLSLIFGGPLLIFEGIVLLLSFVIPKNPRHFILTSTIVNLILQFMVYFIAFHSLNISSNLRVSFDPPRLYSTITGIFVLSLLVGFFKGWIDNKKDNLLLALWLSPFSAYIYTILTWLLADLNLSYKETSYYLVVATEGISIFFAGILTLIILKNYKTKIINIFKYLSVSLIILMIFLSNKEVIGRYFISINSAGRSYKDQEMIQQRFKTILGNFDYSKPAFFYFDGTDLGIDGTFFGEGFLSIFPYWIHYKDNRLVDGCSEVFYNDISQLAQSVKTKGDEKGILYRALCVRNGKGTDEDIFYKKENIHAYKLKNRDFINITDKVLEELGL